MRGVAAGAYDMVKKVSHAGVENFCLSGGHNSHVLSLAALSKRGSGSCQPNLHFQLLGIAARGRKELDLSCMCSCRCRDDISTGSLSSRAD